MIIACVNNEYPPNDSYENLLNWIKEYLAEEYYVILKSTKFYSPIIPYRHAIDDRKYPELLGRKWPQNYILLGDAMCTFNPVYGQGMTHACRQARLLNEILNQYGNQLKDIAYIFNLRASKLSDECWLLSIANDWKTPTLKIIKTDKNGRITTSYRDSSIDRKLQARAPFLIQFFQWYSYWFFQCASKSGKLSTDFLHVMNQQKSLYILMKPTTLLRVLYKAFTSYFYHF